MTTFPWLAQWRLGNSRNLKFPAHEYFLFFSIWNGPFQHNMSLSMLDGTYNQVHLKSFLSSIILSVKTWISSDTRVLKNVTFFYLKTRYLWASIFCSRIYWSIEHISIMYLSIIWCHGLCSLSPPSVYGPTGTKLGREVGNTHLVPINPYIFPSFPSVRYCTSVALRPTDLYFIYFGQ